MTTTELRLTAESFRLLWTELGLGRMPYPLDVSRGTGAAQTLDSGTSQRAATLLRLLDDHEVAVDAIADIDGPVRALAVSNGNLGVLAVIDSDEVTLSPIRPTALAREVAAVLPEAEAGPGHAFSVPFKALQRAASAHDDSDHDYEEEDDAPWGGGGDSTRSALENEGVSGTDAALLDEIASTRTAGGQFGVTRGARRSPVLITWFDTDKGRYLMVRDGDWLSLAPADTARITSRIESVLSAAR